MRSKSFRIFIFWVGILIIVVGNSKLEALEPGEGWTVVRQSVDREKLQTDNFDVYFYDMHFIDAQQGWLMAPRGFLWHTCDGGKKWIAGDSRAMLYTHDGGKTWIPQHYIPQGEMNKLCYADGNLWAVGRSG